MLDQWSTNSCYGCGPTKFGPQPRLFIYSFTFVYGCFHTVTVGLNSCNKPNGSQSLKQLLSGPLKTKFADLSVRLLIVCLIHRTYFLLIVFMNVNLVTDHCNVTRRMFFRSFEYLHIPKSFVLFSNLA